MYVCFWFVGQNSQNQIYACFWFVGQNSQNQFYACLAQSVEHAAVNRSVGGPSPSTGAR